MLGPSKRLEKLVWLLTSAVILYFCFYVRYIPTMSDVEMYKAHKGPVAELHIVDQYMMEVKFFVPHIMLINITIEYDHD